LTSCDTPDAYATPPISHPKKKVRNKPATTAVRHFVASYLLIPHSTTRQSPVEVLYGRQMRTLLDLMAPCHTK
jgi:hypothetical protein